MSKMIIDSFLNGKLFEHTYFIHEEDKKECVCIDPGYESDSAMEHIEKNGYRVENILLTHGHFDHMLGCFDIYKKFNSRIFMAEEDFELLYNAEHNYANLIKKTVFDEFPIYKFVKNGEVLDILGYKIKCISTPGHTKGGVSYYFEDEKALFSGDTLFYGTYGRIDLYGGSYGDIRNSIIDNLFLLPDDTKVYPGHGETTTIGYEKTNNEIRNA